MMSNRKPYLVLLGKDSPPEAEVNVRGYLERVLPKTSSYGLAGKNVVANITKPAAAILVDSGFDVLPMVRYLFRFDQLPDLTIGNIEPYLRDHCPNIEWVLAGSKLKIVTVMMPKKDLSLLVAAGLVHIPDPQES